MNFSNSKEPLYQRYLLYLKKVGKKGDAIVGLDADQDRYLEAFLDYREGLDELEKEVTVVNGRYNREINVLKSQIEELEKQKKRNLSEIRYPKRKSILRKVFENRRCYHLSGVFFKTETQDFGYSGYDGEGHDFRKVEIAYCMLCNDRKY